MNSASAIRIAEILTGQDPDFAGAARVYAREFQGKDTGVDPADFAEELRIAGKTPRHAYHLWALRPAHSDEISGMASFFTFPAGGFGGYLILSNALRGKGLLRELIGRVEDRMRRDALGARGWYIECDPRDGTSAIFRRCGFRLLDHAWFQPPLPAPSGAPAASGSAAPGPRLELLYKPFASSPEAASPSRADIESFLAWLKRIVYKAPDSAWLPNC